MVLEWRLTTDNGHGQNVLKTIRDNESLKLHSEASFFSFFLRFSISLTPRLSAGTEGSYLV